ncbi:hypothetical protein AB0E63_29105 [Kribbella sp. NPDC026596]|uniref:hypothetical protein n=1 Tax=Kribbella sp. NPDC026596 TaxID=3155122 RepID=UPI0033D48812
MEELPARLLHQLVFGAWLLGIGILRTAVGTPTLSKATEAELRPHLAAVAEALFGRPIPTSPPGSPVPVQGPDNLFNRPTPGTPQLSAAVGSESHRWP